MGGLRKDALIGQVRMSISHLTTDAPIKKWYRLNPRLGKVEKEGRPPRGEICVMVGLVGSGDAAKGKTVQGAVSDATADHSEYVCVCVCVCARACVCVCVWLSTRFSRQLLTGRPEASPPPPARELRKSIKAVAKPPPSVAALPPPDPDDEQPSLEVGWAPSLCHRLIHRLALSASRRPPARAGPTRRRRRRPR